MKKFTLLIVAIFALVLNTNAQSSQAQQRVSFHYINMQLGAALTDISQNHQIHFSYSSDFVPVHQIINAHAQEELLPAALDILFAETQIVYAFIGNQIALKVDARKKQKSLSQLDKNKILIKMKKDPVLSRNPVVEEEAASILVKSETPEPSPDTLHYDSQKNEELATVEEHEEEFMNEESYQEELDFEPTFKTPEEWRQKLEEAMKIGEDRRVAQISILPGMSTTLANNAEITNHFSVNLLWGTTGGVQGFEVGGFVNNVTNDVKGFQVAGLGNKVGKDVIGTQVGGLFNYTKGTTKGLQAAGLINFSGNADAAQAAGLANVVAGDLGGVQASGLFNKVKGNANALQAAGLFNVSGGKAKVQIGALFNKAKDVEIGQLSTLNVAKDVKGFQIGFINISDTVSGVPIGLINIVKKGYNKVDLYASEIMPLNLSLKLGARSFYNIFHLGVKVPRPGNRTWGLGYGIGTVYKITEKRYSNFEAMVIHVNENDLWTTNLNMIGHLRFLHHWKLGASTSFFFGPTFNLMVSTLRNEETGEVGSSISPYSLFNTTSNHKTNYKGWVGVNVGFRF